MLLRHLGILLIAAIVLIYSLKNISRKKKYFQKYPDSVKKDFYKQIRLVSYLNYISTFFLVISTILMSTNLFLVFVVLSIFLSVNAISYLDDDYDNYDNK